MAARAVDGQSSEEVGLRGQRQEDRASRFGPGLIIAASFIGPGTITTSIVTGAEQGFVLAWAVVFSILATIVLQEMSGRLGLASRMSLGHALREVFSSVPARLVMTILVVAAIGIGGASYAGGDMVGTALALTSVTGLNQPVVVLGIVLVIGILLWTGSYKLIEWVLTAMVMVLGLLFIVTAVLVQPPIGDVLAGMFIPRMPPGTALLAIALIGTTVVPYNLFLHASLVQEKWGPDLDTRKSLRAAKTDTTVSISVGGIITLAVMATAFGGMYVKGMSAETGRDLAAALEPLLGDASGWVFAAGLFAAGFTSAVAGPLGAAYAIAGTLGKDTDLRSIPARIIWISVLVIGAVIALTGTNPTEVIVIAQAANGLLLPIVAVFLMVVMNSRQLIGPHRNGPVANVLGGLVCLVVIGLAIYQLGGLAGLWE